MKSNNNQPFIDSRAYNKANSTYVSFPSQTDAMLASLQLFHDVPCRVMNLIFSVVTHPDFDSRQAALRNSMDVINVVGESRLKDRMDPDDLALLSSVFSSHPNPGLDLTVYAISNDDLERINSSFHGVRTLYVGGSGLWSMTAWMELTAPHCSNLKALILSIGVYEKSDFLDFIPSTVQSLSIRLYMPWPWHAEYYKKTVILGKSLQSLLPFERLSELKSLCISFSEDCIQSKYNSDDGDSCKLHAVVREFDKGTRDICAAAL